MAFIVSAAVSAIGVAGTISAVGVGLSAYGAYKSSQANKAAANSQAEQARINEQIAIRNAEDVVKIGESSLFDQKKATLSSLSQVRAGTAGAGFVVDMKDTTGMELYKAMAEAGELDITRLKENIDREEQRALDTGAGFAAQADQFKAQARGFNPLLSGFTAGVSAVSRSSDILFPTKTV